MPNPIVIVEDDESIRTMLEYYFKSMNHAVLAFESGEAMFEALGNTVPELCILDIMLPGMDGLEILNRLRKSGVTAQVPVIMLTARAAEMDKVAGLEQGADDYITKPFGLMELQARVKAVLRRAHSAPSETVLKYEDLEIDPAAREVRRGGELVELTYKEFELLRLLVSRKGTVLTRDEILTNVWGYEFSGETRTVDMHIKALRRKLGDGYITTVRGVGYKV
ncbi:MAG: response regulator transcription factor [Oscillospiraceae bacterium]